MTPLSASLIYSRWRRKILGQMVAASYICAVRKNAERPFTSHFQSLPPFCPRPADSLPTPCRLPADSLAEKRGGKVPTCRKNEKEKCRPAGPAGRSEIIWSKKRNQIWRKKKRLSADPCLFGKQETSEIRLEKDKSESTNKRGSSKFRGLKLLKDEIVKCITSL